LPHGIKSDRSRPSVVDPTHAELPRGIQLDHGLTRGTL
jgi:hypothetical protein